MVFTKRLREGIRRGRIRCSIRIWARRQVRVGGRYPMDEGHVVIDSIEPITMRQVTGALARESGFESRNDLLQTARHGSGGQVFLIRFHYVPPGGWDASAAQVTKPDAKRERPVRTARKDAFDLVRTLARTLPGIEESTSYGSPSLKLGGKMFACLAVHRSAEANTLVVRVDIEQRDALLADDPDTYYLTEHYEDYPCVLARLSRIHPDALKGLLVMGWRFASRVSGRRSAAVAPLRARPDRARRR